MPRGKKRSNNNAKPASTGRLIAQGAMFVLLCLVLLALGLALVCTVGWFLGLFRCAAALISAAQLDRSLRDSPDEWNFH